MFGNGIDAVNAESHESKGKDCARQPVRNERPDEQVSDLHVRPAFRKPELRPP